MVVISGLVVSSVNSGVVVIVESMGIVFLVMDRSFVVVSMDLWVKFVMKCYWRVSCFLGCYI